VENSHNTTNISISHRNFLPLYKEARAKAYTEQNVKSAFRKTGIVPFLPRMVLPKKDLTCPTNPVAGSSFPLNTTPYTKCQYAGRPIKYLVLLKQQVRVKYVSLFFASLIRQSTTSPQPILPQARCRGCGQKSRLPRLSKRIAELLAGQE